MISRSKISVLLGGVILILIVTGIIVFSIRKIDQGTIVIILAPNEDYASRALGEYIASVRYPVVIRSLDAEIFGTTKDIQATLASYSGKHVEVYAPSYFGEKIGNNEQRTIHKAFVDVVRDYPDDNASFYFYEDSPYTAEFNEQSVISLQKNIENSTGFLLEKLTLPKTQETVYKIFKI